MQQFLLQENEQRISEVIKPFCIPSMCNPKKDNEKVESRSFQILPCSQSSLRSVCNDLKIRNHPFPIARPLKNEDWNKILLYSLDELLPPRYFYNLSIMQY